MRSTLITLGAAFLLALPAAAAAPDPSGLPDVPASAPPDVATIIGPPTGRPLSGVALEQKTEEVSKLIRCPVCQGSAIADSPADMARNMKSQVRDLVSMGYETEQILWYFELSYGEFIRLNPRAEGVGAFVWVAPVAALLLGIAVVALAARRLRKRAAGAGAGARASAPELPQDAPRRDTLPDDPELAGWVRRVREQVYGWPDGVPPPAATAGTPAAGTAAVPPGGSAGPSGPGQVR